MKIMENAMLTSKRKIIIKRQSKPKLKRDSEKTFY